MNLPVSNTSFHKKYPDIASEMMQIGEMHTQEYISISRGVHEIPDQKSGIAGYMPETTAW